MLKLLGSALILGAGAWLRWNTLAQQRRQRQTLRALLSALRRMAEEIRMARTALPLLLERLAGQCGPDAAVLFSGAAAALRRGEPLAPVWRTLSGELPLPDNGQRADRILPFTQNLVRYMTPALRPDCRQSA